MRIIDNANTTVEFSALKAGECFMYDNCLFMKIISTKSDSPYACNAVCFVDNAIASIPSDFSVIPVNAEIVIRHKVVE